jgi:hypothetical protein
VQALFEWVDRFRALDASTRPLLKMNRVSAPSALSFEGSIVRVAETSQSVYSFGAWPARLSVLAWPDTVGPTLADHAVVAQLGALLTLATNRKIQVAAGDTALDQEGSDQRFFLPVSQLPDRSLFGPIEGDVRESFEDVLTLLIGLPASDRKAIGAAVELHYAAVLLYELDLVAAYSLVVAGLEVLSREYETVPADWQSWEHASRFESVFEELSLGPEQVARLRNELLTDRQLRLRQGFARYVATSLGAQFWDLELQDFMPQLQTEPDGSMRFSGVIPGQSIRIGQLVPFDKPELMRRLLASYDARSSYVHAGERHLDLTSSVQSRTGGTAGKPRPLEFAGIRLILRELIWAELKARSIATTLPDVHLFH